MTPLKPGSTIGILGGGQLGRLLSLEAARLGFDVHIYCPEASSPAARVSAKETIEAYTDEVALRKFSRACDVVTYEFENIPATSIAIIEAVGTPVRPGAKALDMSQDRAREKAFLNEIGIPTVAYKTLGDDISLEQALDAFGGRGVLKTRRDGYDGKGQVVVQGPDDVAKIDAARALAAKAPCILEAFAPFEREVSVIVGRSEAQTLTFDIPENIHKDGILDRTIAPANIAEDTSSAVVEAGIKLANALDYIGVLALEFFVMPDGSVLANEFAPRVHNSGHWTPEACMTGQFEQHIRAVAGWPLGPVERLFDIEMQNLLGDDVSQIPAGFDADARIVSYGKHDAKPGRKMAHITKRKRS